MKITRYTVSILALCSAYIGDTKFVGRCLVMRSCKFPAHPDGRFNLSAINCSRKPDHTADVGAARLDLSSLDSTVQRLFTSGLAVSTQKVYGSGSRRYNNFCDLYSVSYPYPMSENILVQFALYLYTNGVKAGTIKSYLAAVRHAQISLGLGDSRMCEMPRLEYII